ncbi:hypothetical protein GCM10009799_45740 [Nocardiopsis rhodophaea]|uniref:Uncharacterized protein n=1 Tax=Nocardiopsis rhodophaea TaxID=280238 RepID=A0ABP5F1R6_9ACTN
MRTFTPTRGRGRPTGAARHDSGLHTPRHGRNLPRLLARSPARADRPQTNDEVRGDHHRRRAIRRARAVFSAVSAFPQRATIPYMAGPARVFRSG